MVEEQHVEHFWSITLYPKFKAGGLKHILGRNIYELPIVVGSMVAFLGCTV